LNQCGGEKFPPVLDGEHYIGAFRPVKSQDLAIQEPLQTTLPAWCLSLILHLVLFIAIALAAPRLQTPMGPHEETRQAAIVLVDAKSDAAPQYLTESDAAATESLATSSASATASSSDRAEDLTDLLPAASGAATPAVTADFGRPLSAFKSAGKDIAKSQAAADAEAKAIAAEQGALYVAPPTGPTAKVSVFGSAPAEGRTFTFVIDRSSSMGQEGLGVLGVAADQLEAAINTLEPTHKFQVIAYNQRPTPLGPKHMVEATEENKRLVKKFFITVGAYGGTDHELAMVGALAAKPDVLFLLTDGGDPFITPGQFRRLRDMAKGRTTIHCIQFGKGPPVDEGEVFMRKLSAETGGSYTYVDVNR
jgi:hypothetical protein